MVFNKALQKVSLALLVAASPSCAPNTDVVIRENVASLQRVSGGDNVLSTQDILNYFFVREAAEALREIPISMEDELESQGYTMNGLAHLGDERYVQLRRDAPGLIPTTIHEYIHQAVNLDLVDLEAFAVMYDRLLTESHNYLAEIEEFRYLDRPYAQTIDEIEAAIQHPVYAPHTNDILTRERIAYLGHEVAMAEYLEGPFVQSDFPDYVRDFYRDLLQFDEPREQDCGHLTPRQRLYVEANIRLSTARILDNVRSIERVSQRLQEGQVEADNLDMAKQIINRDASLINLWTESLEFYTGCLE